MSASRASTNQCSLSRSANQFAVELFQCYLNRHGDKYRNLLLCPYLIYHSLAMMLVGARGETAEQLHRLLRIPEPGPEAVPTSSSLGRPLSSVSSSESLASSNTVSSQSSLAKPLGGRPSRWAQKRRERSPAAANRKRSPAPAEQSQGRSRQLTPDGPNEARHREFLMLTEQLLHGNHDFVHLASFIYLDKTVKRSEQFKALLRDYYETKPKKLEFNNVDLMVRTVNEDVARTTENIYSDILSRQEAQKLDRSLMLLVSAVFFRGFWLSNFSDVKQAPFFKSPADAANHSKDKPQKTEPVQYSVSMMSKLDYLPVLSDEQLEARCIKMPFEASDLQMLLILPNGRQSDSTYLCQRISAAKIDQLVEELDRARCRTVRVSMPIFCIDSGKISIQSTLVTMGASHLFDQSKANLTGVSDNRPLWLNKILHRCFIVCDNRGAITSSGFEKARRRQAGLSSGRSGVLEFLADHPFMYIIVDSVTRTILLIGLYTDPSETLEVIHENQLSPEEAHQIYTEGVYRS